MSDQKKLICVVGPTAIGKTSLAIDLASYFKTEIISADSRQFYKEMSIGTAVPSPEELSTVPHHFIQHKSIHDTYTVGDFEKDAIKKIKKLFEIHDRLVLVGGSGLYVKAILEGLDEFPEVDDTIRNNLNTRLKKEGLISLQQELKKLDPSYFEKVDINNPHRLIRALEVCLTSGKPYSSFLKKKQKKRDFIPIKIGLTASREIIYKRINQRVDIMMQSGLIEEVIRLYENRHLNALQTVGYKELFFYKEGKLSLDAAVDEIKKNTRRFAKRQLTWYRKDEEIIWYEYNTASKKIIDAILQKTI